MKPTNNSLAITPENLQLQLSIGLFEYTDTPIRPGVSTVTYTGQSGNHMWTDSSRPITHVKVKVGTLVRVAIIRGLTAHGPSQRKGKGRYTGQSGNHTWTDSSRPITNVKVKVGTLVRVTIIRGLTAHGPSQT